MKLLFYGVWLVLKWAVVGFVKVVRAAIRATQRLQAKAQTTPNPRRYFWVRFSIVPAIVVLTLTLAIVSTAASRQTHLTGDASSASGLARSASSDSAASPSGDPSAHPTGVNSASTETATGNPDATGGPVVGVDATLPDSARTPGATNPAVTQSDIGQTICVSGWTSTVRPSSSVTTRLKIQQLQSGYSYDGDMATADYEEDHLISLELGGSPASPLNLWPEPYNAVGGARVKDQVENKLHSLVCSDSLTLAAAQMAIATNWWAAYEEYVGNAPVVAPAPAPAPPAPAPPAPAPPAPVAPAPAPPAPASPPISKTDVTPGAFCTPGGAYGLTSKGTLMQCKTSATDTRDRWRAP